MRIFLGALSLAGMFFFVCPVVFCGVGFNFGNIAGILLTIAAISFWRHGTFFPTSYPGRMAWVVYIFLCILGISIAIGLVESVLMVRGMQNTAQKGEDLPVLILGCGVRKDKPSKVLQERLDTALEYLEEHETAAAILCGGQGADEEISEAECMSNYLQEKGIAQNRLYLEDQSKTTRENLANAAAIMAAHDLGNRAVIVTSDFHCYRAAGIARDNGLEPYSLPSHTFWLYLPTYWVREWFGILAQSLHHAV